MKIKAIEQDVTLDRALLRKQIKSISKLTKTVNNEIGDHLTGVMQVIELFEDLPKGEYTIKFKVV